MGNKINAISFYKKLYRNNLNKIESLIIMKKIINTNIIEKKPIDIYFNKINEIIEIKYNIYFPTPIFRYNSVFNSVSFSLGEMDLEQFEQFYDLVQKYCINMPENCHQLIGSINFEFKNQNDKFDFMIEYINRLYEFELKKGVE